jgi:hypothetical protein
MRSEIEKSDSFMLNKNIVDKLSRLTERKFFNINLQVAKIYDNLLEPSFFKYLNNDTNILISFANNVLNLLEVIKSTMISSQLEKKCNAFLNYILTIKDISSEQLEILNELIKSFPTRNSSEIFKNVIIFLMHLLSMMR